MTNWIIKKKKKDFKIVSTFMMCFPATSVTNFTPNKWEYHVVVCAPLTWIEWFIIGVKAGFLKMTGHWCNSLAKTFIDLIHPAFIADNISQLHTSLHFYGLLWPLLLSPCNLSPASLPQNIPDPVQDIRGKILNTADCSQNMFFFSISHEMRINLPL